MKRIFSLLLLLVAFNASAIEINRFLSGSWNNPDQNGHGFSIEVISDDLTVFYWYVYNPDGSPTFLLTAGENNGNVTKGKTYYNYGMKWGDFNPADRTELEWIWPSLSFMEREILFLWAVEGYSTDEVASQLDRPRNTVLSIIHRMRKRLKQSVGELRGTG